MNMLRTSQRNSKSPPTTKWRGHSIGIERYLHHWGVRRWYIRNPTSDHHGRCTHAMHFVSGMRPYIIYFKSFGWPILTVLAMSREKCTRRTAQLHLSEADLAVSAATNLVESMRGTVPATAAKKQQHTKVLKQLLAILNNGNTPRVADGG